jgi:hypothetical protein
MTQKPEVEHPKQRASSRATGGKIKPEPPAGKHESPASVQPVETEDPHQMGSGKPVQREMLEKNVHGAAEEHPETVAAQHATGSYTGRKRRAG